MAKSKTTSKKTGRKGPAKKKAVKKVVAKKRATKKVTAKKKAAPKKASGTRKPAARVAKKTPPKKTTRRKTAETVTTKQKIKENKEVVSTTEAPPPVEEKSQEVNVNTNAEVNDTATAFVPGMDKKSIQQAAVRNYDNHHIRLSTKKGGIKPSGKKPLW